MQDQRIVGLFWARDESAIASAAAAYGGYCYRIAYNILQNREDADECVNDTWLSAWNAIPPHKPENLATFLGKLTRNHALNRYEKRRAQKRGKGQTELALEELKDCVPTPGSIEDALDEKVLTAAIEQFLLAQPPLQRKLFVGRYWYLYSVRDMAKAYGIHESRAASILLRMRNKLKLHLQKEGILL